jgi:hypothetical protein
MIQTHGLAHVLYGMRPFLPEWFKVLRDAPPLKEGAKSTFVDEGCRTWPEQHGEALDRLLSRAELELAELGAARRSRIIAHHDLVSAPTEAEHARGRC